MPHLDHIAPLRRKSHYFYDAVEIIALKENHFMRFKVELTFPIGTIVKHIFYADNLEELDKKILKEFPKGKVLSIVGGGE